MRTRNVTIVGNKDILEGIVAHVQKWYTVCLNALDLILRGFQEDIEEAQEVRTLALGITIQDMEVGNILMILTLRTERRSPMDQGVTSEKGIHQNTERGPLGECQTKRSLPRERGMADVFSVMRRDTL